MEDKENRVVASSSSKRRTLTLRRLKPISKLLQRRASEMTTRNKAYRKYASKESMDGMGSELLSAFSKSSEAPLHNCFKKSDTILSAFTDDKTGEHLGFLKEVMPERQIVLHQRNVWDDGWLMEVHFTFKSYIDERINVALKFVHVHDNLAFLRDGDEPVKVEADKRYIFALEPLQSDQECFVVKRVHRTGNPRMMEMSYRFGYKQGRRWKMTF